MKSICDLIRRGFVAGAVVVSGVAIASAQDNTPAPQEYYRGVGPAVAGSVDISKLPDRARKFITKHVEGTVVKCEKEFMSGEYDVKMSTGVEIEFDKRGKVIEVDAPGNSVLPAELVKAIVPGKLYRELSDRNMQGMVESIEHKNKTYDIDFQDNRYDEGLFTEEGQLIVLYED